MFAIPSRAIAQPRRGGRRAGFFRFTAKGRLVAYSLAISKHWGQPPDWFDSLPKSKKTLLLADYANQHQTKEEIASAQMRYNKRIIEAAKNEHQKGKCHRTD